MGVVRAVAAPAGGLRVVFPPGPGVDLATATHRQTKHTVSQGTDNRHGDKLCNARAHTHTHTHTPPSLPPHTHTQKHTSPLPATHTFDTTLPGHKGRVNPERWKYPTLPCDKAKPAMEVPYSAMK
jgi:hypothetical protein